MLAFAIAGQLVLVGGVAATRGAHGQVAAFGRALLGVLRAIVPVGLALLAIIVGSLALAVPGVMLLALLAGTGAHANDDVPATTVLARAVVAARPRAIQLGALALAMIAVDVVVVLVAHKLVLVLPAKPQPAQLAVAVTYVRVVAAALVVVSPPLSVALTALAATGGSPSSPRPDRAR